jgi:hypothetical protein
MANDLAAIADALGLHHYQRHIFRCTDPAAPKCAPRQASLEAWDFAFVVRRRAPEKKIVGAPGLCEAGAQMA